jgi:hypothetical protein
MRSITGPAAGKSSAGVPAGILRAQMPAKASIVGELKYDNNGLDLILTSVREYRV